MSRHQLFRRGQSRRRTLTVAAVPTAAVALLLAGCSGASTTATAPPAITFATDVSATPGMAGMSSIPGMPAISSTPSAPESGASAPAPASPNAVAITNFAFAPLTLNVPVGTTVTWTNHDEEPHTVVANDGSFRSPGLGAGGTYSFTFTNAGSFDYVCSIHPFMHGTVVVK